MHLPFSRSTIRSGVVMTLVGALALAGSAFINIPIPSAQATSGGEVASSVITGHHKAKKPLVFAHRGSSKYAPEETVASFKRAIKDGADTLEGDIAQTKDGELVIIHDDTLNRTTNVEELFPDRAPWNVRDFTLDEIKQLDAGSWFDPAYAGEEMITLQEWVEFTDRRVGLYPEIKNPELYPGIVENVANELKDLGYTSEGKAKNGAPQIWIQSRNPEPLKQFHELLPDIPVNPFGIDGEVYSYVTASDEELEEFASWGTGTLCHPGLSTAPQIDRMHDFGVKCVSEVSDSPELIGMAVNQGYDVVLTDAPDVAKAVIKGKNPLPNRNGVIVDSVVYNPEGDDVAENGGEYVLLRNTTKKAIDISGYTLRDYSYNVLQVGEDAVIEAGSFYTVYVGPGTDTETAHFNGFTKQIFSDTLTDHVYLYNPKKVVEDIYAYFVA